MTKLSSREIAVRSAHIASEKKVEDIVIYAVEDLTFIAEYFVVCSGINERQLKAISDDIRKEMRDMGVTVRGIEGYGDATWILIDLGGVIVHLFNAESRTYYDLDLLWGDAPKIEWESEYSEIAKETV